MKIVTITATATLNELSAKELAQLLRRNGMEVTVRERKTEGRRTHHATTTVTQNNDR